ncbi:MAG: cobyric acid synthase [Treponemataceae bacterium]
MNINYEQEGLPHGGDIERLLAISGLSESEVIDASANINPLGPPFWLDATFNEGRRVVTRYPDAAYRKLKEIASKRYGISQDAFVFGNGADELIFALANVLREEGIAKAIVEAPSYASYKEASMKAKFDITTVPAHIPQSVNCHNTNEKTYSQAFLDALKGAPALVWIGVPNNPTGFVPKDYPDSLYKLAKKFPRSFFAIDEAFIEFTNAKPANPVPANCIVIRSMTKFWAVPGLRIGYAILEPSLAKKLKNALPNWSVNSLSEAFARMAMTDTDYTERVEKTKALVNSERKRMADALTSLGIEVLKSSTNYYLIRIKGGATHLANSLARKGIAVRSCSNFEGLGSEYLRLAVRTPRENDAILEAIRNILSKPTHRTKPKRAKALMIQGCTSSAGKSLIAAAFCRIFRNEGIDVAPYKAQNMSLNSAVTSSGLEIGRAQAVQALACGLEAEPRMSPVLLKPESDCGSQVILMGKPYARYQAREYYTMREKMQEVARKAYDNLASEHDLIILEGAGSPAEINLKKYDFVNMGAAKYANAKVLLVGDIDKGGVFASFIGHIATFLPDELALFSGFIINKFRGDPSLLVDAFEMTRVRTGFPVIGTVPMLSRLDIPDEDDAIIKINTEKKVELRLAVPRLTRLSNFTDMDAFSIEPDVELSIITSVNELDSTKFDAVILPDTKSTVADLQWLKKTGLADAIIRFANEEGCVVGICGGYQMLGKSIIDEEKIETTQRETCGLGLLPLVTSFCKEKTLSRTKAIWQGAEPKKQYSLLGYEIHHGETRSLDNTIKPFIKNNAGKVIGYGKGQVWGSYLHGLFDADDFRRAFLNELRQKKGLLSLTITKKPSLDSELDRLAEVVKSNVNMSYIRKLLEMERL